jgi:uncharacterized protein
MSANTPAAPNATPAASPPAAATPPNWPVLSLAERRILGVLAEKQKTTPDSYPLSLNALVTGCNQKSNRDPILNLTDVDVEEALGSLQKKGLAIRLTGSGRVEKWRHNLYEAWQIDKVEMAVLAELLLRGPQTEGELRSRASRMDNIADLDALRLVLRLLTQRRLVVYLTPEGRRGTTLTHGFHAPDELARLRAAQPVEPPAAPAAPAISAAVPVAAPPAPPPAPAVSVQEVAALRAELAEARDEIAALKTRLGELQTALAAVTEQVRVIKEGLGL